MAAAASGNMALMVEESSPELRLLPGDGGGRPMEFREVSTFNLDMASLKRFDIASGRTLVSTCTCVLPSLLTLLSKA